MAHVESISQFKSITGCSNAKEIEQYLEACNFDLASAVDLYFTRDSQKTASTSNDVQIDGDDDIEEIPVTDVSSFPRKMNKYQRMANGRRRADANNGASTSAETSNSSSVGADMYDDDVRAPIPSTRGVIVEQSFQQQYGSNRQARNSIFSQGLDFRQQAVIQERELRRAQNGLANNGMEPEVSRTSGQEGRRGATTLQALFRPPVDIMFQGDWEAAREMACSSEKWLLVNIQDLSEFACQTLNRDVFNNCGVKELLKTNFIFWQIVHNSTDGERLRNYYRIQQFPAMFIVDPRTGELIERIELKKQDALTFCDKLTTFLDRLPDFSSADRFLSFKPVADVDICTAQGAAAEPECSRSESFTEHDNEMVDARESVRAKINRKRKGSTDEREVSDKRGRLDVEDEEMLNEDTRNLSVIDVDEWKQEISPNGTVCDIKLKMPDEKICTLQITNESKLKALLLFIGGQGLSTSDHMFVLSFPRREFSLDEADCTLRQLGFTKREMVHVELK